MGYFLEKHSYFFALSFVRTKKHRKKNPNLIHNADFKGFKLGIRISII